MMTTKTNVETLTYNEIYSLVLFALYKLKDDDKFSTLSELAFILDKDSLIKLCEYYGESTITIPSLKDFRMMINALLLYEMIDLKGYRLDDSIKLLNLETEVLADLISAYQTVKDVISNYSFNRGE